MLLTDNKHVVPITSQDGHFSKSEQKVVFTSLLMRSLCTEFAKRPIGYGNQFSDDCKWPAGEEVTVNLQMRYKNYEQAKRIKVIDRHFNDKRT